MVMDMQEEAVSLVCNLINFFTFSVQKYYDNVSIMNHLDPQNVNFSLCDIVNKVNAQFDFNSYSKHHWQVEAAITSKLLSGKSSASVLKVRILI